MSDEENKIIREELRHLRESVMAQTTAIVRMESSSKAEGQHIRRFYKSFSKKLNNHHIEIHGDKDYPGLKQQVLQLSEDSRRRKWHLRTIWVAVMGAIASMLGSLVSHK